MSSAKGLVQKPGLFGKKKDITIEIRPTQEYILVQGSMDETRDTQIFAQGTVVLTTKETIKLRNGIWVALQGFQKTMHSFKKERMSDVVPARIINEDFVYEEEQELNDPESGDVVRTVKPGTHTFPYRFELPGDISESIEGIPGIKIEYNLKAYAERTSRFNNKLECRQHLRIVRTLGDVDREELWANQEAVGEWEGKCRYTFGTTSSAFIFGDAIRINFSLTPYESKLRLRKIRVELWEKRKCKTIAPSPDAFEGQFPDSQDGWWVYRHMVDFKEVRECTTQGTDLDLQLDTMQTSFLFDLPRSLSKCRQTVQPHPRIEFTHRLHYLIDVTNPDGTTSGLRANKKIRLFISPHLPIGENNTVQREANDTSQNAITETLQENPPLYGDHSLDQLYQDVTPSGFQSPGPSSTAYTPHGRSRQTSQEAVSSPVPESTSPRSATHAEDLEARLRRLQLTRHAPTFTPTSPAPTRNASIVQAGPVQESSYDLDALSRQPSYNTAARSAVPETETEFPPSYADVTSRPGSPGR